jgi:hypothetical protein
MFQTCTRWNVICDIPAQGLIGLITILEKYFLGAHEWGQSAQERHVFFCGIFLGSQRAARRRRAHPQGGGSLHNMSTLSARVVRRTGCPRGWRRRKHTLNTATTTPRSSHPQTCIHPPFAIVLMSIVGAWREVEEEPSAAGHTVVGSRGCVLLHIDKNGARTKSHIL